MSPSRGCFLTFEGVDGAGKTSHLRLVEQKLHDLNHACVVTREPGGTPVGEVLRELVLHQNMVPKAELLALYAARVQHIDMLIEPALAKGAWVLSDRFEDSSFAYQTQGQGVAWLECEALSAWALGGFKPDLTFLFDLPIDVSMARIQSRSQKLDKFEVRTSSYFEQVRKSFLKRAQQDPSRVVLINALETEDQVAQKVECAFDDFYNSIRTRR